MSEPSRTPDEDIAPSPAPSEPAAPTFTVSDDETTRLESLTTTVRNQDDLEADIGRQADAALLQQATERDEKRLDRALREKQRLVAQVRKLQQRLTHDSMNKERIRREIQHMQPLIDGHSGDIESIQKRMQDRSEDGAAADQEEQAGKGGRRPGESTRDFMIRTGKITPFSNVGGSMEKTSTSLSEVMHDAEDFEAEDDNTEEVDEAAEKPSHQNLRRPGFQEEFASSATSSEVESTVDNIHDRPRKRRRIQKTAHVEVHEENEGEDISGDSSEEFVPEGGDKALFKETETDEEDMPSTAQRADYEAPARSNSKPKRKKQRRMESETEQENAIDLAGLDDGNEEIFRSRLKKWTKERRAARQRAQSKQSEGANGHDEPETSRPTMAQEDDEEEPYMPHPTRADTTLPGNLNVPGDIFPSLFDYQKTGVRWLWELYQQKVGGIIGDEMGLGKTIQAISFIAALHHSRKLDKPVIIVCPATVMKQWVSEFHTWWPALRVSILHTSGSGMMDVRREAEEEEELEVSAFRPTRSKAPSGAARKVVDRVLKHGHVLVTTYTGLQTYAELLIPIRWGYAVLDEGHKIRNPNTSITIYCKELKTHNRIILSGTPMQNNLAELWSLFDFVFPMRLGTLVNFRTHFEIPIKQGGYANASELQVQTALKCAEAVKDAISPYLLQRVKVDVAADLPKKSEQVLFCKLTKLQRQAYQAFLNSSEMEGIYAGRRQPLYGIDILRKICNHPDLQSHKTLSTDSKYDYGSLAKSGKMQVVKALLELWSQTGHKTLLFAQNRITLDILQKIVGRMPGIKHRRMDGNTAIKDRQDMVDEFNKRQDLHVFLLTTKVGGLGVNLTGADRVIIFDPDWNPSTDVQARERAWRLGQKREVMIYRLMTAGTIEEKIYHRQIFKQFLTNKILRDPKQRQTFQLKDLHDLFTLADENEAETETKGLFQGSEIPTETVPSESKKEEQAQISSVNQISHTAATAQEPDKSSTQGRDANSPNAPTNGTNPQLLSTLFPSAVHSTLSHDAIMSSNDTRHKRSLLDPEAVNVEARRVAREAAKHLQAADKPSETVGIPTWTGEFGSAGRPPSPTRGLTSMRGGRGARGGAFSATLLGRPNEQPTAGRPRSQDFMRMIRDYLQAQPGCTAYTQMLINHFDRFCATEKETAEFKEMLRRLAVLEKSATAPARGRGAGLGARAGRRGEGSAGRGKWVLRKEFGGVA